MYNILFKNKFNPFSKFSILLILAITTTLFPSCKNSLFDTDGNDGELNYHLQFGSSIQVINGNILISGVKAKNREISSKFWVNGKSTEKSAFMNQIKNQSGFREAINNQSRIVYNYKDNQGNIQEFQFFQSAIREKELMPYFLNGKEIKLSSDSTGTISAVSFYQNKPIFAGTYGKFVGTEMGSAFAPKSAFIWEEISGFTELIIPKESQVFNGITSIYRHSPEETYVAGLCGIPMYWKNTEAIVLNKNLHGEVHQIIKIGNDLYAVGLINKRNSNSTGHTACYWKNGEIHELEDNAQAYGIFVDGTDVYITGATGVVPTAYKPCYWKNGKRIDLEM